MRTTEYPIATRALIELGARRPEFEKWMDELDAENKRLGSPYGDRSLWDTTGPTCWIEFFEDGVTPLAALEEDLSNA